MQNLSITNYNTNKQTFTARKNDGRIITTGQIKLEKEIKRNPVKRSFATGDTLKPNRISTFIKGIKISIRETFRNLNLK